MPDAEPTPEPQPAVPETFWQRSATRSAILASALLIWAGLRKLHDGRDDWQTIGIDLGESLTYVWGSAIGVTTGRPGLRATALLVLAYLLVT